VVKIKQVQRTNNKRRASRLWGVPCSVGQEHCATAGARSSDCVSSKQCSLRFSPLVPSLVERLVCLALVHRFLSPKLMVPKGTIQSEAVVCRQPRLCLGRWLVLGVQLESFFLTGCRAFLGVFGLSSFDCQRGRLATGES